jgi:PAS domain S-box-containing protein
VKPPSLPTNEGDRLEALRRYEVLDTPPEPAFDALAALAAHIAGTPIALVSLVDVDRQWFKARYGLDAPQTPRDVSFCGHVVAHESPLIVPDALEDQRFADNPLVTGEPRVRFYAGVPLRTPDGFVLGTLCAIDHCARELTADKRRMLDLLADQVMGQLELRRGALALRAKQAELEATARETEEVASRLHSILASASHSIIETAPDGTVRVFNAAAERMLGYAAAEVVDRTSPAIFHDPAEVAARAAELTAELGTEVRPGFDVFVRKALRDGVDERAWTYVRKDGTRLPVSLSVTVRRDAEGAIAGYMGIASDISALKHRTSLLRLGADIARAFTASDALGGMLQRCAEALVAHLGAAFARIWVLDAGEGVLVMRASAGQYTHLDGPHGRVPVGKFKIGLIAEERRPHLTNAVVGDPRVGDQAWARREGMVSFAGYPLLLDERVIGVVAMFARYPLPPTVLDALGIAATNLAIGIQRKEADARLRENEVRLRSIIDAAVDAVVTIDVHGRIAHANPALTRLFGYTPAEVVGQNVRLLMPSPDRERHDGYLESYRTTGQRKIIGIGREVTGARKDGSTFPAELAVSEFFIDGERFFTGIIRDITDRRRIERLQSEFISTVSHELRTPLTSIRGSLGLVSAGVTGELPSEAKEYVDIALTNSDRLVRLINDILDIEKMHSGKMEFRLAAVDLAAAVRGAIASNQAFAGAHKTRLLLTSPVPEGEVLVDPDRLAQVLTNLISNAAKFSPPDASVEVTVVHVGSRLRVAVRDHGPGIPAEFHDRIFQRFAQADASSTRQKGGTGLGLNISKAIIEMMGGTIGFEAAPGGGTAFFFELPYLAPITSEPAGGAGRRLLVCEDDPDVSRLLERLLTSAGFRVHVAPTLERARRLLAAYRFDAITLDLVLADGDGATLIHELRARAATSRIPVIVISGSDPSLSRAALLVTDVIPKPFDEQRLLAAVECAVTACRTTQPRLLHVEDDPDIRRIVKRTLPDSWSVSTADSLKAAKALLAEHAFDLVLLDLSLPDGAGDELLGHLGGAHVIIFSASDASMELSQRVSAALVKSKSDPQDLKAIISRLLARSPDSA